MLVTHKEALHLKVVFEKIVRIALFQNHVVFALPRASCNVGPYWKDNIVCVQHGGTLRCERENFGFCLPKRR